MYAIVDVNNFYASCERIFDPGLINKPIVVLSNNDGCVIARSNEAKKIGIDMGVPFFKVKNICIKYNIKVFSSNYTLYGNISKRFINILEDNFPNVHQYSIDECFIDLHGFSEEQICEKCNSIIEKVQKNLSIPISIGVGKTKTIAKTASFIAKNKLNIRFLMINNNKYLNSWLKQISLIDIWNIGKNYAIQLQKIGINTPYDFIKTNKVNINSILNVNLLRTHQELNGISCINIINLDNKKSITVSRSLGIETNSIEVLKTALIEFCSIGCQKLRNQNMYARSIGVFIKTSPFKKDLVSKISFIKILVPTNDTREFINAGIKILESIFDKKYMYNKLGVIINDLSAHRHSQHDLFIDQKKHSNYKSEKLMQSLDSINAKMGKNIVFFGATKISTKWKKDPINISKKYTTNWKQIPIAHCK